VPKMKKSYHSIVVPMRLAKATLRDERKDGPPLWSVQGIELGLEVTRIGHANGPLAVLADEWQSPTKPRVCSCNIAAR